MIIRYLDPWGLGLGYRGLGLKVQGVRFRV